MKKTSFLYGALGLMTLGLAACNSDMPEVTGNGTAQTDEVRFLRVAITNPMSSRAATFEDGTDAENAVGDLYFRFYDAAGNPIESATSQLENVEFADGTENGNVGKVKEVVLQLTLPRGANYPSYVVCFINPVNYAEISTNNSNMSALRNEKRTAFLDNAGNFAMNNSVYYGHDPISGTNQVKILGAPILAEQLFTSEEAANEATGDAIVNIYVERYAAKVRLTIADNAVQPVTVGDYTLTFVPEAWTVNADAPNMYASKRFEDTDAETTIIPTYAQVQDMLGGWTAWNDAANHRSYWACSPSYYATDFPQVSDDIIDNAGADQGTGAGTVVAPYALRYYSYNQITATTGPGAGVTAFNNGGTNWKYTMENTVCEQAFQSLNPKAAVPSVLIVGHYDLSADGGTTTLNPGDGFCIYNGKIYFRNNVPQGAAENATTMKTAFLNQNMILAINEGGTLANATNLNATQLAAFTVKHPNKTVRGIQPIPHRYVTLQLTSVPAGLYYKPAGTDTWTVATADDLDYINTLLWQQLGNASSFTQNKCYFSLPIQHLGLTENTTDESPYVDGELVWTKVRVGDFGLVRNHVYDLSISKIQGRATGIEDLANPLVPSVDETNYWIKYQINILNWRVVPKQENIVL